MEEITKTIDIEKVISWQTFTTEKSQTEWAQFVKNLVYRLIDQ